MYANKKIYTLNDIELPVAKEINICVKVPTSELIHDPEPIQGRVLFYKNKIQKNIFVFVFKILFIWFSLLVALFLLILLIRNI